MAEKDYTQGKIYMIINTTTSHIYVGSTTKPLYVRWGIHKRAINITIKKDRPLYKAIAEHGAENFVIILLENYPCEDEMTLREREVYYEKLFDSMNTDIGYNVLRASRTKEEKRQLNYEYYLANKEKHRDYLREWRKNNPDQRQKETEKMRSWREKNREHYNAYQREFRKKRKEQANN